LRRSAIRLEDIADTHNLAAAFHAAAKGKRGRGDVEDFRAHFEREIAALRREILEGALELGRMRCFRIHDPKPRLIHAPCFRERVLHHAVMALAGPVLDRALVFDSYACRVGKGTLAAVQRVRAHASQFAWYGQIDIAGCFASIDHAVLRGLLARKFRDEGVLGLLSRIVGAYSAAPGRGLPIGALTSQCLANFYLDGADRELTERVGVRGFVRYMDDLIWWGEDQAGVEAALGAVRRFAGDVLRLRVKQPERIGMSREGIRFCGYRVWRGRILLSRRRQVRYGLLRAAAERGWVDGALDGRGLQAAYACARGLTAHADAAAWRRAELRRRPVAGALAFA